jgi:hypothetical protein
LFVCVRVHGCPVFFANGHEVLEDRLVSRLGMAAPGWRLYLFEAFEEIRDLVKNFAQVGFASVGREDPQWLFGRLRG